MLKNIEYLLHYAKKVNILQYICTYVCNMFVFHTNYTQLFIIVIKKNSLKTILFIYV